MKAWRLDRLGGRLCFEDVPLPSARWGLFPRRFARGHDGSRWRKQPRMRRGRAV